MPADGAHCQATSSASGQQQAERAGAPSRWPSDPGGEDRAVLAGGAVAPVRASSGSGRRLPELAGRLQRARCATLLPVRQGLPEVRHQESLMADGSAFFTSESSSREARASSICSWVCDVAGLDEDRADLLQHLALRLAGHRVDVEVGALR